jgi:tRNA-uridine 2-sulfurtransferase
VTRVLVAMSGGVDSSVAAALVKQAGDEAVGVWMRLSEAADFGSEFARSCCSLDAAEDARRVASQLGIPFYILNLEREFDEAVIRPFVASYLAGETPSPCVACNTVVKFGALLGRARMLYGCDAVATGHYARVGAPAGEGSDGRWRLLRGLDPGKDQSYFLYGLGQEQLAHTRFPLGEMTKPRVRELAAELGLATAAKRDSQEICFVPRGDYRDVLREKAGWEPRPGPVVDMDGVPIGEHHGAAGYTVGQRQGVGIAVGEPRFVWKIDPSANTITVGRREELETRRFEVHEVVFVAGAPPTAAAGPEPGAAVHAEAGATAVEEPRAPADGPHMPVAFHAQVQVRHRGRPAPAVVSHLGGERWSVELEEPVWAAAPGQAAVIYRDDEVLGGGRIARPG